jgi:isocitrate dehydrogenase kinase/phosphatase
MATYTPGCGHRFCLDQADRRSLHGEEPEKADVTTKSWRANKRSDLDVRTGYEHWHGALVARRHSHSRTEHLADGNVVDSWVYDNIEPF